MKLNILCASLILAASPIAVQASEADCFPLCVQAEPGDVKVEASRAAGAANDDRDLPGEGTRRTQCDPGLVKQAEDLNEKIRPLREIVGYVRAPQGLVIKMVNDHIVKIPVWVGYAVDPVGSIRHKAAEQVRSHTSSALGNGNSCKAAAPGEAGASADSAAEKQAI